MTILSLIVPCLSHFFQLIGRKLILFSSTHPHSKQNLIDLIKKVLGVFIDLESKEHSRIHPRKISETGNHITIILVLSRYNLPVRLCRNGMRLSCVGLGYLEKGCPYLTILHGRRIDRNLIIHNNLLLRRNSISLRSISRIRNLFSHSSRGCNSCVHRL